MAHVGRTTRLGGEAQAGPPSGGRRLGELLGGRYRLETLVGWGGQALVYAATDLQARPGSAHVAIKLARPDLAADVQAEAVTVLRWEAHLLRRLRHPGLPRLHRFHSDSQATWLARDMVAGMPLSTVSRGGPVAPAIVLGWAIQLCDLLTYLHTQAPPVICGDLKPANLVLRPNGALVLIDLGAAQTLTKQPPRQARPRHGTPGYAPPEQLGNWGHDERSDLFSLAVTCYELLTGLDPTSAPLQFELDRLDAAGPTLASAMRWALALDRQERSPSATSLRARLAPLDAPPLRMSYGASLSSRRELLDTAIRHPRLIDETMRSGDLERWLARHPDQALGGLIYCLREARSSAPKGQTPIDTLLAAMAPASGTPHIQVAPSHLQLGAIPLKSWRVWSRPNTLVISNSGADPARWELECAAQPSAELRVLVEGKPQRKASGALAPGGKARLELVAAGVAGPCTGTLTVRSGAYTSSVTWEGHAQAGISIAGQFVGKLADLDLSRPDGLIGELEAMFVQGSLGRWLRAQGERALAKEIDEQLKARPDELARRLIIGRLLHPYDPLNFPLIKLHGIAAAAGVIFYAGQPDYLLLEVENLGAQPCLLSWSSQSPWATVALPAGSLPALARMHVPVRVSPPSAIAPGSHALAFELRAGALRLPIVISLQFTAERWWQRIRRWINS